MLMLRYSAAISKANTSPSNLCVDLHLMLRQIRPAPYDLYTSQQQQQQPDPDTQHCINALSVCAIKPCAADLLLLICPNASTCSKHRDREQEPAREQMQHGHPSRQTTLLTRCSKFACVCMFVHWLYLLLSSAIDAGFIERTYV
jgi:hypothetical protein